MPTARSLENAAPDWPTAVVWLSGRHAVIAVGDMRPGGITSWTTERMVESRADFLARIVRAIGSSERVMVLGPASMRLAVQRAYVGATHRPDRLMDATRRGVVDPVALEERVRALGA